ncbi:hypothetical protein SKAU_G00259330 [Synaphobranchus kaupii]|uniref:Uncharacterized protein n=1 Tax=Synaphobranchus kaupii TaxID=118154 RepID=A0A9Q1F4D2_SYNKA|nr:hypothetical protein SKAU_G00259330 [Synaphobranchus kaupii]
MTAEDRPGNYEPAPPKVSARLSCKLLSEARSLEDGEHTRMVDTCNRKWGSVEGEPPPARWGNEEEEDRVVMFAKKPIFCPSKQPHHLVVWEVRAGCGLTLSPALTPPLPHPGAEGGGALG